MLVLSNIDGQTIVKIEPSNFIQDRLGRCWSNRLDEVGSTILHVDDVGREVEPVKRSSNAVQCHPTMFSPHPNCFDRATFLVSWNKRNFAQAKYSLVKCH